MSSTWRAVHECPHRVTHLRSAAVFATADGRAPFYDQTEKLAHDHRFCLYRHQLFRSGIRRIPKWNPTGDSLISRDQPGACVCDPACDHLPLEFSETGEQVQQEPIERAADQLRHRSNHQADTRFLEFVQQCGAIGYATGQPIKPMNHDRTNEASPYQLQ